MKKVITFGGHLPAQMIEEWASHQASLSELFKEGGTGPSDEDARRKMARSVHEALVTRSNFTPEEIKYRINQVEEHLKDPGLLENFRYFNVPASDFMLQFYFAVWDLRIAELMDLLHNYGKDLKGTWRRVPEDDVWFQMSRFEGMNIDARKKAQSVVDFIRSHNVKFATSFGGGNIPERLYGLPANLTLTVFDDGPVSPLEELNVLCKDVRYYKERLSQALFHKEMEESQDLIWMHGVSMYLDESQHQMTGAILAGARILKPGGFMKYEYLIQNESMRRVISTQCWPYDPKHPMTIFRSPDEAIRQGRITLERVNRILSEKGAYVVASDPEATLAEPWGITSLRFTVQKRGT